ncbi:hypothetical protein SVAN01_10065 [Stagonosporopsis vannaccii]|nr:hypothetical protein SVAN01_10065 [Stagonosporopsis vannaccii]
MSKPTHWYCSECGDGPLLIANNVDCPNCYHRKCTYCQEETIYPKYSRGDDSIGLDSSTITNVSSNVALTSVTSHDIVVNTCHKYNGTTISTHIHGHQNGPMGGGEVVYLWRCSQSWADNRY